MRASAASHYCIDSVTVSVAGKGVRREAKTKNTTVELTFMVIYETFLQTTACHEF